MKIKNNEIFTDCFVGFTRLITEDDAQGWGLRSILNG